MKDDKQNPTRQNIKRKDTNDELERRTRDGKNANFTYPNKRNKDATPRSPEEKLGDKEGLGSSVKRNIEITEQKEVLAGPIPSTPSAKIRSKKQEEKQGK